MHTSLSRSKSSFRPILFLPLLILLLSSTGCSSYLANFYFGDLFGKGSSTTDKNADQLAQEGMQKMHEKDYGDALKAFQALKERYPYSKYAILAELKLGDAHFHNKEYSDAAMAYEEFARLHPRNEVVPYVYYQIGMCHFLAFSTTDRDQAETQTAIESFQRLIQAYPESEYAQRARKQIFECQKRIVAHEFHVGQFYFKNEHFSAAKERLEKISQAYPEAMSDLGHKESVQQMLAECEKQISLGEKKPSVWTRAGF